MRKLPAHILKSRGVPITLLDAREVVLLFTFSSLMRLEEEFGSVAAALGEIQKGDKGAAFGSIARIMAAGLEHEHDGDGKRLDDTDVLRSLLDSVELEAYSDALGEAFEKAFPEPEGDDAPDPQQGATSSPGTGGGTPAPSHSDAPTPISGA